MEGMSRKNAVRINTYKEERNVEDLFCKLFLFFAFSLC